MGILRVIKRFYGPCCTRNYSVDFNTYIQRRVLSDYSNIINSENPIIPVLIVGAGPVGLVLSILLSKFGVKCAILEKSVSFAKHPQAHFINNRSMEVFRKLNGLADEILSSQPPVDLWRKFIYCSSLTGPILGSVDHLQPQDFDGIVSPVSVAHFSQYKLTSLLIKQLEDIGFLIGSEDMMLSDICWPVEMNVLLGHECTCIRSTNRGITVSASLYKEGNQVEKNFLCNFLIGADGAGSTVRKLMGISMNGVKDLQNLISIHFMSLDLGQYLINERPGDIPFYPPQQKFEDFSTEVCESLIFKLVGQKLADINILDIKPWIMHAEVAEKLLSSNNRVILAGNAAHRFPPAGGFGMNTGIQDAQNLAWKLASVLKGIAAPSILSTYETERRQIAIHNTALSIENFKAAMAVPAALGIDPTIANSVHRTINKTLGSILHSDLQRTIMDGIFSIGRLQLSESLLNDSNPFGSSRLSKLKQIFEEGKSLQLQFPSEDLGFRYTSGALIPDDDNSSNASEPLTGRRRDYVPSSKPGSRLPHMKIKLLSDSGDAFSTLDLVSVNNLEFLLIIASIEESFSFARAAFKVAEEVKVPLKVCIMWPEEDTQENSTSESNLAPWKNFIDVIEVKSSPAYLSWWDLCQMTNRGAILVRPDEHIAWRARSEVKNDPFLVFKTVLRSVMGM